MAKNNTPGDATYAIGPVARLTGLTAHTLRVWERRHGAVEAQRSAGGHRQYTQLDVDRLRLMKHLTDRGDSIAQVADLSLVDLQARLDEYRPDSAAAVAADAAPPKVAVFGDMLPAQLAQRLRGARVVVSDTRLERFRADIRVQQPEVLILELTTIGSDTGGLISELQSRSGAQHVIVAYDFARQSDIDGLTENFVTMLRSPVNAVELENAIRLARLPRAAKADQAGVPAPPPAREQQIVDIAPRCYSQEQLMRLAAASSTVECECPTHLAQLVDKLTAFEVYSAQCESRNEQDAALHAYLHATTAQARSLIEGALTRVAQLEGLDPGPA